MLKQHEPVSAFIMYSMKRKNAELLSNSKKLKKHNFSEETSAKINKKKIIQRKLKQQSLNGRIKNQVQRIKRKTKAVLKESNPSVSTQKTNCIKKSISNKQDKGIVSISNRKGIKSKAKLKKSTLSLNAGIAKVKYVAQKQNKNKTFLRNVSQELDYSNPETIEENHENPLITSRTMFEWLIYPTKVEDFFQQNWEKKPHYIKRNCPNYYKLLMSTRTLDKVLRDFHILFTKNIDITSYENGIKETHNPPGRAVPSVVWDYYMNGCSVRMLNPHTYIPKLHSLNATLQEFFGCFVGANSYLTPPNSQGFAPHYDDIEAFILQIEGKKRWRLYKPLSKNEYLPRYSSENFTQSDIGTPILDTILYPGDLLYFPRGTIHQGEALDTHSLHVTLSVYQKNTWGDFLENLLPDALKTAIETDIEFRKGLPLDYLRYCGLVHSECQSDGKRDFKKIIKDLFTKLIQHIDVDKTADLMARDHIHDFIPPVLTETEQECSVIQDGEEMTANGVVENRVEIEPDTRIRLLRSHCVRLVKEDNDFRIYYSTENSKEYHEYEPQFLEVCEDFVPAIREIILRYPEFISVEDLPIDGEHNKIQIAKDLWEKCLLVTDHPLCTLE